MRDAVRDAVRNPVEIGEGEALLAGNQRFVTRVQRAEDAKEFRKRRREVVDDHAAELILADHQPSAGADDPRQFLVEATVELARHFPPALPLPFLGLTL